MALATDYFTEVGNPGTATTLSAPGHTIAGTTFNVVSTTNWPTTTGAVFAVDRTDATLVTTANPSGRVPGSYTEWEGVVASGTSITGAVLRFGTDQNYSAGSTTRVYIPVAASRENRLVQGISLFANQDATLKTAAVQAALGLTNLNGYTPVGYNPNTVTANGNRSYSCVFNSVDLSTYLSAGMRLRTTRTVAAPTQCTSLNGTTQYYSKTSPAGMTFTNNFVVSAWVKLSAYPAAGNGRGTVISRYNGTSGFVFDIVSDGRVELTGFNAGGTNYADSISYQSIPLNKWVNITAQMDMSTTSVGGTNNYIMIDGVEVPNSFSRSGTSPTTLVQAGNLEIGSENGGTKPLLGKIAQAAIYSAKVTQATILASMNQGLAGTETSLISAYSFNNSINDLNTTNANNLTANGGAVATNTDAPFGGQADGTISSTLDYAIIQKVTFATNTTVVVQVPEGCTIPTSGGVSAVVYSSVKAPYGMSVQTGKWRIESVYQVRGSQASPVNATSYNLGSKQMLFPIGEWMAGYDTTGYAASTTAVTNEVRTDLATTANSYSFTSSFAQTIAYASNVTDISASTSKRTPLALTTATVYYLNHRFVTTGTGSQLADLADFSPVKIIAENAYL